MKKVCLLTLCLCLVCSLALAEEATVELNWEAVSEEVAAMGEFQQIEITDLPTICFWIPSGLESTDVSVIDGPFQPTALYMSPDGNYSVAVFLAQIESLESYVALMESEGGGSNFSNVTINGVDCVGYEIEEAEMETLIYPVSDTVILSFNCYPLNGDDDWDAVKGVIFTSIQPLPEE